MIKVTAYNDKTGEKYNPGELQYITFFDENGILRGNQDWIKLKYELKLFNDEDEITKIEIK